MKSTVLRNVVQSRKSMSNELAARQLILYGPQEHPSVPQNASTLVFSF
jgi:hypothetical protein